LNIKATKVSSKKQGLLFIVLIPMLPGNEAPTKIRMVCSDGIAPKAQILLPLQKNTLL
jgi:hypothetical protein